MTIAPDRSLSDNLAEIGCTHKSSDVYGKREIYRADGTLVGKFDAKQAWEALGDRPAIFSQAEP